jgi:hypothetical protein
MRAVVAANNPLFPETAFAVTSVAGFPPPSGAPAMAAVAQFERQVRQAARPPLSGRRGRLD